ncbi:hypothetical protein PTSG_09075 [Salpingoeca rosetta]|uniref:Uncharacterized protein n=1 Tax=Salpingoeca rosetta (strain ATCC 50818 / BSB-021) TaxID=946362 RepID=F2UM49_SALR5|nr:uncharacterized protein PTSG_09075 [Salpingoeca rosetta]EGD78198.1 hypothetical protein PTSG_09075 [Salpingoeca rosetta]|eukprot:XP_004989874.1 hypothetical protein PTSG_09075 [Salpingoeca rosetta]
MAPRTLLAWTDAKPVAVRPSNHGDNHASSAAKQQHQHQHQHQHQQPPPPASLPGAVAANTAATSSSSSLSSSSGSRHSGRLTPLPTTATLTPFVPTFTQAYAMQIHQANNTRVLVMINGHCDSAKTMARAIYRTWTTVPGREFVTVRFVVGDSGTREQACSGEPEVEENMMVYLRQCSDDYPPVDKVLCMWEHARTTWLDAYDYFLKVDADTYLNIPNLLVLLAMNPPTRPLFAGGVGSGRDGDLPAYCMGPAYILSRHTLGAVPSDVQAKATKLPNSDTTFSYFVTEHSGVTCMDHVHKQFRWSFMNRYWDFRDGAITGVTLNEQAQSVLPLYHPLNSALFNTVSAHPLKTERDMVVFHEAVFYNRLPLFPNPKATQQRPTPPQLRNLCVYNPARQYEISGFVLRECPPRRPHRPRKLQEAFVLHLAHDQGSVARAMAMAKELRAHSIKASLFNGVDGAHLDTATHQAFTSSSYLASSSASSSAHADKGKGASSNSTSSSSSSSPSSAVHALSARDVGRRETYRLLLHRVFSATDDNDALYLVVEDDVVLSPVFAQRLDTLLQDPRCGSYLSSGSGGALLLGATIARNGTYPRVDAHTGGWAMADEEMRRTPGTMCYNFNSGVENTFAFVLERRAMQLLLTWLSNPSHANQPFDHAWRYLCDRGMPVRVAFPYIVIPHRDAGREHSPVDTSTWEHVHRWTFQNDDKRRRR